MVAEEKAQRGSSKHFKSVAALSKGAQRGSSKGLKSGASEAPLNLLTATPGKWAQNPKKKWTLSKKLTVHEFCKKMSQNFQIA